MGVLFGLVLTGVWFYVVYSGLRHVTRKLGGLFGLRSADSRATWTNQEYRHYADAAALPEAEETIVELTDDMEETLASEEELAGDLRKDLADSKAALEKLEKVAADWADRAALALSKGRNDLARAAVVERLRTQDMITDLKAKMTESQQLLDGYESDIAKLNERLSDTYRRQRHAYARIERAEHAERANRLLSADTGGRFDEEINRLERAADDVEGRAEALALGERIRGSGTFAALEQDARIERELSQLRPVPSGEERRAG